MAVKTKTSVTGVTRHQPSRASSEGMPWHVWLHYGDKFPPGLEDVPRNGERTHDLFLTCRSRSLPVLIGKADGKNHGDGKRPPTCAVVQGPIPKHALSLSLYLTLTHSLPLSVAG